MCPREGAQLHFRLQQECKTAAGWLGGFLVVQVVLEGA